MTAVKTAIHKPVNIFSIYIPPHDLINDKTLNKLIEEIPKPHLLLDDLNSHNTIWGCQKTNKKATDMEKVFNNNNLCILNNKSPLYLDPSTESYSAIDIILFGPSSHIVFTWKLPDDPCGSIILGIKPIHANNRSPSWKINKADWQQFKTLCIRRLVQDPNSTVLKKHFTETLVAIANEAIPKTSPSNRPNIPRSNSEYKIAIRQRNAALRKFKKAPFTSNLNSFKLFRAKARKTIKEAKKIC